jgi:hypothetical protein
VQFRGAPSIRRPQSSERHIFTPAYDRVGLSQTPQFHSRLKGFLQVPRELFRLLPLRQQLLCGVRLIRGRITSDLTLNQRAIHTTQLCRLTSAKNI